MSQEMQKARYDQFQSANNALYNDYQVDGYVQEEGKTLRNSIHNPMQDDSEHNHMQVPQTENESMFTKMTLKDALGYQNIEESQP